MSRITFLDLPGEIRNEIYDLVFTYRKEEAKGRYTISELFAGSLGLNQTCRQIRSETHQHIIRLWNNIIHITAHEDHHEDHYALEELLRLLASLDLEYIATIKASYME